MATVVIFIHQLCPTFFVGRTSTAKKVDELSSYLLRMLRVPFTPIGKWVLIFECEYNDAIKESQQGNLSFSTFFPSIIYSTSMVYVTVFVFLRRLTWFLT